MCKSFSFLLLYGPCIICVYYFELFEEVFVCSSVILFLFCSCIYLYVLYLYDLFHIILLPFNIVDRNIDKGNKVFLKMNVELFVWVTNCLGINLF
jgi:hypothetical protein